MTSYAMLDTSQSPAVVTMVGDLDQQLVGESFVDITGLAVRPEVGWTYDGTTFTEPQAHKNQRTLQQRLDQAIARNQTYLAIPNPTAAQIASQVNALTNQVQALIRIQRNQLDDTT
jgi:hypothetical protein